ncbi:MAG: DUF4031 domain-containing protein [Acidobacteria bacterium]|nr:DUF4031 domain-containing protein [Acidobacteriota bacterium]
MTVYVDRLMPCRPCESWRYNFRSRMHADSTMELHNMARRLGLQDIWYHPNSIPPYYYIPARKRQMAIELGAVLCSPEETHRIYQEARQKAAGNPDSPEVNP